MENVTDIFKTRLRDLRISSNKSQEELANELGISRGAVSCLLSALPGFQRCGKLL